LLKKLRSDGWPLIAFDLGSQVRRSGAQAAIKYHRTREALEKLKYDALAFGLEDIRRLSIDTIDPQLYEGKAIHVGANVNIYDAPEIQPFRIIEVNGYKIGVTAIFGSEYQQLVPNSDIKFSDPQDALPQVIQEMQKENCDLLVLLSHAPLEESRKLAQKFPDFDVVVTAGGADEPPLKLEVIEGTKTKFIELGHKAMYAGVIGFFPGSDEPLRYQKVPLDSRPEFAPTEEMKQLLAEYQVELQSLGFAGLEVFPVKHPRGAGAENPRMGLFAGAESCKQCHKKAWGKWSKSNHAKATKTLIESKPPRQFDPECISCHVTGWNPQEYFPYESGFLSVEKTPHLVGNSCENCHGPGAAHVEAEKNNDRASLAKLRDIMKLRIGDAELTVCRKCHDLDNSPEFNLETYWEKVKHPGKD